MSLTEGRPAVPPGPLLEPQFLRKLEQLNLVSRRVFSGQLKGERRSTRRGTSVEFADFRNYVPGDDLRYVDWNTYARLERLFIKLFVEEEDLHVYLLVDASASMEFGSPSKLTYARKVAAALGYLGLTHFDRVAAGWLRDGTARMQRPARGRGQIIPLFEFLAASEASGATHLERSMRDFTLRTRRRGLVILLSDFLDPGWESALKTLFARGFGGVVVQILSPAEVRPDLVGDLRIRDTETGEEREVTISGSLLKDYERAFGDFTHRVQSTCSRFGGDYFRVTTDDPFEDLILKWFRTRGLVR